MRDFFGHRTVTRTAGGDECATAETARPITSILPTIATAGLALVCCTHAAVSSANTVRAAALGYLCDALIFFGCAAAFRKRALAVAGTLRIRGNLIAGAALAASIGFVPSFTEIFLHSGTLRQLQTSCFNVSEALYILAAVLFFAGVARSIVVLDLLQVLLFVVLRFNLAYSPLTRDHFTHLHLLVGQMVAVFLFLIALVACLGAASRAELEFLRTLSWFFGLRLIAFFTADQVSYVWMGYQHCSLWDVVGSVLLAGFAVHLLQTRGTAQAKAEEGAAMRRRSVTVRSLMPSFLALVNLMLGMFLLHLSLRLAAAAISVSVVCYVARTALLHAQAVEEKTRLVRRNEHLEGLAICDPLTGIGNRRSLAGVYARLQEAAGGRGLALLLMDIDAFKQANDRHGHLHGDRVLVTLARKLEGLAAAVTGSHCARFGGDEFALLLPDISPEQASEIAEELRAQFGAHAFEPENARASLSIGVASLEAARDLPLETLVSWADKALYRAKLLGRDRVEVQPLWEASDARASQLRLKLQTSA